MFRLVLNWLTGGGLNALATAYAKHKDSAVESERIKADVARKRLDNALEADRLSQQVRLATAGFWEMRLLTFCTAAPFVVHAAAVGLDTTFALGLQIAAYPAPFDQWEGTILLSFFGIGVASKAITAGAAVLMGRAK
jgi:hypothetical protein